MIGAKFDIEKFDGTGDFGLWIVKMCDLLIQHGWNPTPPSSSQNNVNQVVQRYVHIDEGGSSVAPPTNKNHEADFDTGYDNDFEGGSPVPPPRFKWAFKKDFASSFLFTFILKQVVKVINRAMNSKEKFIHAQVKFKKNPTPPSSSQNNVNQVVQRYVHIDEGGSSVAPPTNKNHEADFDTGYDNDFEGGSPVPPPRFKWAFKKDFASSFLFTFILKQVVKVINRAMNSKEKFIHAQVKFKKSMWKAAMKEEIDSLRNNKT
uniref:Myb/SANT-like domain, Harbinger transposase-derived nuclease domain protein n=1 Tax=Tanacetum cinerariifolium TaxID=118510 RepID=A0A6L2P0L3_TANCI|nr:myb/SANT-like domain, Harbinger transposase-derived nuclease domain protein [Tanacetum cinerariifolium]